MDRHINATKLLAHLQEKYNKKICLGKVTEATLKEKEHLEYAINLIENAMGLYGVTGDTNEEQEDDDLSNAWWAQSNDKKEVK